MPIDSKGCPTPLGRGRGGGMEQWFGQHCNGANLTSITVPIIGKVIYHKRIAEAAMQIWTMLANAGLSNLVDMRDWRDSGGTYNCRIVRGGSSYSPHAWGVATDINTNHIMVGGVEKATQLNYHCTAAQIPDSMKTISKYFKYFGATWGGDWHSFFDPMHVEFTEITVMLLEGLHVPDAFMQYRETLGVIPQKPVKVIGPKGVIDCDAFLGNGTTRALLRPVMDALNLVTVDHIPDMRQVYILLPGQHFSPPVGNDYHAGPVVLIDWLKGATIECNAMLESKGVRVDLADCLEELGHKAGWDSASQTVIVS
jgi:D-alanyl-D-alanine carboxypeptidase